MLWLLSCPVGRDGEVRLEISSTTDCSLDWSGGEELLATSLQVPSLMLEHPDIGE